MNETTKQKITKALDYSGDYAGAYFNEGELEPLTVFQQHVEKVAEWILLPNTMMVLLFFIVFVPE